MTSVVKVDPLKIAFDGNRLKLQPSKTLDYLQLASETLKQNDVVAFPTETVYGLGANCQSTEAVSKIYKAKNRPADNPLIVHVSSKDQLRKVLRTEIPPIYKNLVEKFWPGPLTILLPLPTDTPISSLCTKGQSTFGCRMPAHPIARALIELSDLPLAAPSANASTKPSCTEAKHVLEDLEGRIPLILDGGSSDVGVESTVVNGLTHPPRILRPGGVSLEEIREFGGDEWKETVSEISVIVPEGAPVQAPGMKYRHYSPKARVLLVDPNSDFQDRLFDLCKAPEKVAILSTCRLNVDDLKKVWPNSEILSLPLGKTKQQISHNLFSKFREADLANVRLIVVEAVDTADEGLAIMNRLNKAAETYIR